MASFPRVRGTRLYLLIGGPVTSPSQRGLGIGNSGELWPFLKIYLFFNLQQELFKCFGVNGRIKFVFRLVTLTAVGKMERR